jgi:hypothetical protein
MHEPNNRASWKRYGGEGVANAEFTFHANGSVSINVEETAFASKLYDSKRDVTHRASMEISKEARDRRSERRQHRSDAIRAPLRPAHPTQPIRFHRRRTPGSPS